MLKCNSTLAGKSGWVVDSSGCGAIPETLVSKELELRLISSPPVLDGSWLRSRAFPCLFSKQSTPCYVYIVILIDWLLSWVDDKIGYGWDLVWLGDKSFKGCDSITSGNGAAPWARSERSLNFVSAFLVALEISQELFLFSKISFCPNHPLQRLMKLEL